MNYTPEFSASAVAAIIGKNPYKKPYEAIYNVLLKDNAIKAKIRQLEASNTLYSLDGMRRKIASMPAVRQIVSSGIQAAAQTENVVGVVEQATCDTDAIAAASFPDLPEAVRKALVKECASDIHKQRGLRNEDGILNQYETKTSTQVSQRNTHMMRKKYGGFAICGRIDGYVSSLNRIVDSKERTVYWDAVPVYDEIQLRVYMDLMDCPESELVERFPNGTTRNTIFKRDPEQWDIIQSGLQKVADEMREAVADDEKLLRIIKLNSFTGYSIH